MGLLRKLSPSRNQLVSPYKRSTFLKYLNPSLIRYLIIIRVLMVHPTWDFQVFRLLYSFSRIKVPFKQATLCRFDNSRFLSLVGNSSLFLETYDWTIFGLFIVRGATSMTVAASWIFSFPSRSSDTFFLTLSLLT